MIMEREYEKIMKEINNTDVYFDESLKFMSFFEEE